MYKHHAQLKGNHPVYVDIVTRSLQSIMFLLCADRVSSVECIRQIVGNNASKLAVGKTWDHANFSAGRARRPNEKCRFNRQRLSGG